MYLEDDRLGTVFFAGVYGVGKSTIIKKLSVQSGLPAFSAGDLISEKNCEQYGANKVVSDKDVNQHILIQCIADRLKTYPKIILAGHFCIASKDSGIEKLPDYVFDSISLEKIILLEASPYIIASNLNKRDHKDYTISFIEKMIYEEHFAAKVTSKRLQVPLIVYEMTFSELDKLTLANQL